MFYSRSDVISTPQKVYLDWFWGYIYIPIYPRRYAPSKRHCYDTPLIWMKYMYVCCMYSSRLEIMLMTLNDLQRHLRYCNPFRLKRICVALKFPISFVRKSMQTHDMQISNKLLTDPDILCPETPLETSVPTLPVPTLYHLQTPGYTTVDGQFYPAPNGICK